MEILEQHGYAVTGLDLSQDMLDIARNRVRGELIQQDMRRINLENRYDAIVSLGSSFTYIQSDEDVENTLRGFFNHLNNDGVLVFDCFDKDRFSTARHGKMETETQSYDDLTITRKSISSGWDQDEGTFFVDWEWTIQEKDQTKTVYEQQILKAHTFKYLEKKLREAGFTDIEKQDTKRLMIKAKKEISES